MRKNLLNFVTALVEKHCALTKEMCDRDHKAIARKMLAAIRKHWRIDERNK